MKLSRRKLLTYAGGLAAATLGGALLTPFLRDEGYRRPTLKPPPPGSRYSLHPGGERPNILVVVVDDLAADVVGKGSRFPFLKTPHLNGLEREGTSFSESFVPTSVCSSSRASLPTGTYPHSHSVLINDVKDLGLELSNFLRYQSKPGTRRALSASGIWTTPAQAHDSTSAPG